MTIKWRIAVIRSSWVFLPAAAAIKASMLLSEAQALKAAAASVTASISAVGSSGVLSSVNGFASAANAQAAAPRAKHETRKRIRCMGKEV